MPSPNIQYCPWCPQVIAFPLAPSEALSCLSTLAEHVMRHHLGRLINTDACIKLNSPPFDTRGPGDTGSGGTFGNAYIPAELIYAYMCPVRKVFVNVYKDPMDGMWYRLKIRCGCSDCLDEAETKHIERKVERKIARDALADEMYWADEEDSAGQKEVEQGVKGIGELAHNGKNGGGGLVGAGGIAVRSTGVQTDDD